MSLTRAPVPGQAVSPWHRTERYSMSPGGTHVPTGLEILLPTCPRGSRPWLGTGAPLRREKAGLVGGFRGGVGTEPPVLDDQGALVWS